MPHGAVLHGAQKLRSQGLTGQGVRVGVIDTGIDKAHPGFNGHVKKQRWYRSGTPLSEDDHGTHVAGTIHMMAPRAEIYDYRVFGEKGDADGAFDANKRGKIDGVTAVAEAIRQACMDGCHVINMSFSVPPTDDIQAAVKYAYCRNVHMVCAAGNSGDGDPLTNELSTYVF